MEYGLSCAVIASFSLLPDLALTPGVSLLAEMMMSSDGVPIMNITNTTSQMNSVGSVRN